MNDNKQIKWPGNAVIWIVMPFFNHHILTDSIPLYQENSSFIPMFAVWPVWNKVLGLAKILKWSGSIAINLASGLLPYFRLKKNLFHFWNTYRISRNYVHVLHVKATHATIILLNVCWSLYKLETIFYSLKLENVKWYGSRLSMMMCAFYFYPCKSLHSAFSSFHSKKR